MKETHQNGVPPLSVVHMSNACIPQRLRCSSSHINLCANAICRTVHHIAVALFHAIFCILLWNIDNRICFAKKDIIKPLLFYAPKFVLIFLQSNANISRTICPIPFFATISEAAIESNPLHRLYKSVMLWLMRWSTSWFRRFIIWASSFYCNLW